MRAVVLGWVALALVVAAAARAPSAAAVDILPPPGSTGWDISYPQCGGPLPAGGAFAVVGVNNGRPFSTNPCLAGQFAWAAGTVGHAELYVNTANPAPSSSFYWPVSGARDPALCMDSSSTRDPGCAYDYGWHAAADAFGRAVAVIGPGVASVRWWLDVETSNSWNGDTVSNAAVAQGALDALRSLGVARLGIYSTGYQWGVITGGYSVADEAAYRSAWAPYFVPAVPLAQVANWVAGALTLAGAMANCQSSFSGGVVAYAQYFAAGYDANLLCEGMTTLARVKPPKPRLAPVAAGTPTPHAPKARR